MRKQGDLKQSEIWVSESIMFSHFRKGNSMYLIVDEAKFLDRVALESLCIFITTRIQEVGLTAVIFISSDGRPTRIIEPSDILNEPEVFSFTPETDGS